MRPNLRSINVLVSAGFLLVALPLVIALWSTQRLAGDLAGFTTATVEWSVEAARDSQLLLEQLTALERNARQYQILGDAALLGLLRERVARLEPVLDRLGARFDAEPRELAALRGALERLAEDGGAAAGVTAFEGIQADARTLTARVTALTEAAVADNLQRVADTRTTLTRQATAVVPIALGLGLLFGILIVRPVRALALAIRQLGRGNLTDPIRITGPTDLERLGQRLDWLRSQLAAVETEKSRFLRHVSHELKTPLANVREASELLLDRDIGGLSDGQREIAEILRDNGLALQRSIENLLNFNAWQDKEAHARRQPCETAALVHKVLQSHRLAMQRAALTVDTRIEVEDWFVDPEKVEVMLDNLVANAVKFSPDGGTITIRVGAEGTTAVVEVSDQGPGVDADESERIFEAFQQGKARQKGHVKGTGIGLSVVRECARMHGGGAEVVVGGEQGGGHFRIRLADAVAN